MLSALAAAAAFTSASDSDREARYLSTWFENSVLVLGSEDPRIGFGVSVTFTKPDPKLRFGKWRANLGVEAYLEPTHSPGVRSAPPNDTTAVGILGFARYRNVFGSERLFFDIGWGLQYNNRTSVDISGLWMSTPIMAVGWSLPYLDEEYLLSLRFMHISNGGTAGNNQGQNQFQFMMSYRF